MYPLGTSSRSGAVLTGALVGAVSELNDDAASGASVNVEGVAVWRSTMGSGASDSDEVISAV